MPDLFMSCDWGTSNFRLRLVDSSGNIQAEVVSEDGIAATFDAWKQTRADRFLFFRTVLDRQVKQLANVYGEGLDDKLIIISGMVSSTIGMLELPYCEAPLPADGSGLLVKRIDADGIFKNPMIIVSGVRTSSDILRGEETLLAGCEIMEAEEQIFIFPGTHSKHIFVSQGIFQSFKTYMTGEVFDLLVNKSVLSNSLITDVDYTEADQTYFDNGVLDAQKANILNKIFSIRVNQVLKQAKGAENALYLSGLLIGTELQDLGKQAGKFICIVANEKLGYKYSRALALIVPDAIIKTTDAAVALVRAHLNIRSMYSK